MVVQGSTAHAQFENSESPKLHQIIAEKIGSHGYGLPASALPKFHVWTLGQDVAGFC